MIDKIFHLTDIGDIIAAEISGRKTPGRLLFGRGGGYPGLEDLNIDIFPPLLFVTLYGSFDGEEVNIIRNQIDAAAPGAPLLIQDRSRRPSIIRFASQNVPEEMTVHEGELEFLIHPRRGQNPGFFPDMRSGRRLIAESVAGMKKDGGEVRVLNLFSYTCALSVAALAAGADGVVNIDMNRRSLDIGRRNHRLNLDKLPSDYAGKTLFLPHDIFKSFGKLRREGPYGLIIADPPPDQKGSFSLRKDYPKLIRRLPAMLNPGGTILLTLNSGSWSWNDFEALARNNLEGFETFKRVEPPEDYAPEEPGRGLKIIIAEK